MQQTVDTLEKVVGHYANITETLTKSLTESVKTVQTSQEFPGNFGEDLEDGFDRSDQSVRTRLGDMLCQSHDYLSGWEGVFSLLRAFHEFFLGLHWIPQLLILLAVEGSPCWVLLRLKSLFGWLKNLSLVQVIKMGYDKMMEGDGSANVKNFGTTQSPSPQPQGNVQPVAQTSMANQQNAPSRKRTKTCVRCKGDSHALWRCPMRPIQPSGPCKICGERHWRDECPKLESSKSTSLGGPMSEGCATTESEREPLTAELELSNDDGRKKLYFNHGRLDGKPMTMVVDCGSTHSLLPWSTAHRMGLILSES